MRPGWRKLAERAANSNFDGEQTAEAIPDALGDDWRHERCDELVREIRAVLNDDRQGLLFDQNREEKIQALKNVSSSGYPLRRLLLECVSQALEAGEILADAIRTGTERALGERLARGSLQVEEHYRRRSSDRTGAVRSGLQGAALKAPLNAIVARCLRTGETSIARAKRDGLDDGVSLP
jgi:hypothetical protein